VAGVYRDTKKRVGGEFRPMRDWIDQLRFIERVAIVILISVIVILEIADTRQDLVALGKVVFETAASAVMAVNGSLPPFNRGVTSHTW
jgi:hypothetical protein